jgi:phosphoribosylformylglycinamidine cyclo-ligase
VRAALELLRSGLDVRGLAHITGDGLLNLLRLAAPVGWRIDAPLPVPAIFEIVAERMEGDPAELWEVFNMGCGFCCVVPEVEAEAAVELLERRHPGAAVIGRATPEAGRVELPALGLVGVREEGFRPVTSGTWADAGDPSRLRLG